MDTICDGGETDTSVNLFGKEFKNAVLCRTGWSRESALQ